MNLTVNSYLKPFAERRDPEKLWCNKGLSFKGSFVLGMGFTLTPAERTHLIAKDPKNGERIFPYLGGKEVNTSPMQTFHRYVIDFGVMSLDEAGRWPDLLDIVRCKVKPERDRLTCVSNRKWWHFGGRASGLYASLAGLSRCLVTSEVTKHLCFSFQPTGRVFANTLQVFPLVSCAHFSALQSRIHESWARLLSSTMKTDLRYSNTDCFDSFPFPGNLHMTKQDVLDLPLTFPAIELAGQALYEARAAAMVNRNIGLTKLYNLLKDPACIDSDVIELRRLHEDVDREVLRAYGWHDLAERVPPYEIKDEAWESEIVDRLWALNHERAKHQ
jgi:hypothetical protein